MALIIIVGAVNCQCGYCCCLAAWTLDPTHAVMYKYRLRNLLFQTQKLALGLAL